MNKTTLIIIGLLLAAAAGFAFTKMDFLSGRIHMTFSQKPAPAAETDKLGKPATKKGQKVLVAYFSWGGNTLEESLPAIEKATPGATYKKGATVNMKSSIKPWLKELGLL